MRLYYTRLDSFMPQLAIVILIILPLTIYANPVPLGVPGTWQLTLDEEFDGTSLNTSLWTPQLSVTSGFVTGQSPGIACYVDTPNNIAVGGGYLNLTVRKELANFTCGAYTTPYTSGMVSTLNHFYQAYGVFEVRARLPDVTVPGLQETFWLWPQNQTLYGTVWPASGEIDFAEFYSQYYNLVVPYLHYNATSPSENVTAYNCAIDITQFNTYSVEWNTTYLTIYYNGKVCFYDNWNPKAPLTKPQPFSQPFFLILTQALGVTTNAYQDGVTPLPATTVIDYVRVWESVTPSPGVPAVPPSPAPVPASSPAPAPAPHAPTPVPVAPPASVPHAPTATPTLPPAPAPAATPHSPPAPTSLLPPSLIASPPTPAPATSTAPELAPSATAPLESAPSIPATPPPTVPPSSSTTNPDTPSAASSISFSAILMLSFTLICATLT